LEERILSEGWQPVAGLAVANAWMARLNGSAASGIPLDPHAVGLLRAGLEEPVLLEELQKLFRGTVRVPQRGRTFA
jgi:hypothetical protein